MTLARLDPKTTLLVLIDVQEKLAPAMPPAQLVELERAAAILLEAAHLLGVRVIATEQYPEGLGRTIPSLAERLTRAGVVPISKTAFSAVSEPAFVAAAGAPLPASVVLLGMEAHICVFQTARDLAAHGVVVHVPRDGVASRRDDHREAGLSLAARAGAVITTAETIAFDWLGSSRSDAFRAVSRLVR